MASPAPVRVDCHNHVGVELGFYLRGNYPYAQTLPQLLAEGDTAGISHFLVFPMVTHLGLSLEGMRAGEVRTEGALEAVPYAWENRRLLEEVYRLFPGDAAGRVFPLAMADPLRATDAQAAALRTLWDEFAPLGDGGRPFYGLKFQTTMLRAPIRALLDQGRVLLDFARERDLPLLVHSSVYPEDPWAQASDILDVAERVPDLRFCVAHSCRFDRECLERVAALPNAWFDCSAHIIHCRLACADSPHVAPPARRFDSDYARPEAVLRDLAAAYPGKLLWGSDSPYHSYVDADLRLWATYRDEADCLLALPAGLLDRVARDNAARCFRLPGLEAAP
ncbi:MAG TPA: amidohydrolase family protein [Armatimonadaceae bacterium]|nr:amidohydrolase family protein [Armatimonadaceae bacterium]